MLTHDLRKEFPSQSTVQNCVCVFIYNPHAVLTTGILCLAILFHILHDLNNTFQTFWLLEDHW